MKVLIEVVGVRKSPFTNQSRVPVTIQVGQDRATAPVDKLFTIGAVPEIEVTPSLVIVRPDPNTDWPGVTLIPVPADTVPVAVVFTKLFDPTYKAPCEREGNLKGPEKLEEAVENNPPKNPIVVEVEL